MDKKSGFAKRLEKFFDGRGFYIVLSLCVLVTGVSAWVLLTSDADTGLVTDPSGIISSSPAGNIIIPNDDPGDLPVANWDDGDTTDAGTPVTPSPTPAPTPTATPTPQPAETDTDNGSTVTISDLTFIWPLSGEVSQVYSPNDLLFSKTMNDWRTHDGIDIAAQLGTKVMTVADGTVEEVYTDDMYGTTVVIYHADGLRSLYANLAATPTVKPGDAVTMGSVIGSVSDSAIAEIGEVTHLHFAVTLDGEPVDPATYLPKR